MLSKQIKSSVTRIINFGIMLVLFVMVFTFGPWVDGKYFTVMKDFNIEMVSQDKDKMIFQTKGNLVRNCSLTDLRVLVDDGTGLPKKGAIWMIDNGIGSVKNPLGYQDLGMWAIQPTGNKIHVHASYKCHGLWTTEVELGVWSR